MKRRQGKARRGVARHGKARRGKAKQGEFLLSFKSRINIKKKMKKVSRKYSYDNIWALEQVANKLKLGSTDLALRYVLDIYAKLSKIAQECPIEQKELSQITFQTKIKPKRAKNAKKS